MRTGGASSHTPKPALLQVLLWALLWAISLSYGFSDWAIYRKKFLLNPEGWKLHLLGGIEAPFQYRIGSWIVVDWMNRLFHAKPYDTLTLIDVSCLLIALWAVFHVLEGSARLINSYTSARWIAIAVVLFLTEYYVDWGHWFQVEETMPSILFVVLSITLVSGKAVRSRQLACCLLVVLACLQGFFRADIAVVLHAGFFLAILIDKKLVVPLGRTWQAGSSLLAALLAGCVQLYLMLVRFPNARYGTSGLIRFTDNLHPGMFLTMLLGLFPYWVLLGLCVSKRYRPESVTIMLLTGSLLYLPLWATVGLIDEVRIFLPFAFALMPATALALISQLPENLLEQVAS